MRLAAAWAANEDGLRRRNGVQLGNDHGKQAMTAWARDLEIRHLTPRSIEIARLDIPLVAEIARPWT